MQRQKINGDASLSMFVAAVSLACVLSGCGGGGGSAMAPPPTGSYDLQAGISMLVSAGLTSDVAVSGSFLENGSTTPLSGSGTVTFSAGVSATFNGTAALSQTENVSATLMAAGQSIQYTSAVADYYASGSNAYLGQSGNEYDVAQTPFTYPTTVSGGESAVLGTVSRYMDSTMSVSLGSAQISYQVTAATSTGGPVLVAITEQYYDTQNNLIETDVFSYNLTAAGVLSLASASVQDASGTLILTAQ